MLEGRVMPGGQFAPKRTFDIPESEDLMQQGHLACPGCGVMPMFRLLLRVFGRRTVAAGDCP